MVPHQSEGTSSDAGGRGLSASVGGEDRVGWWVHKVGEGRERESTEIGGSRHGKIQVTVVTLDFLC
jgi:hypothetical protein